MDHVGTRTLTTDHHDFTKFECNIDEHDAFKDLENLTVSDDEPYVALDETESQPAIEPVDLMVPSTSSADDNMQCAQLV